MYIIPAIDIRGGNCVRLFQGDYAKETVYGTNPGEQARAWQDAGAKMIHLVDLDGAKAGHPVNTDALVKICKAVDIPCELGGGIRTREDAETVFKLGISRVILGTAACKNPNLAVEFIEAFGTEKVVLGIDARDGKVAVSGWTETSDLDAFQFSADMVQKGVRRIIFTDISTDGALCGPNLASVSKLCKALPNCNIVASGGVSCPPDAAKLQSLGCPNLEGVIVGKALYDGRATFAQLTAALN